MARTSALNFHWRFILRSKTAFINVFGLKTDAVILDFDPNLIAVLHQFDVYLLGLTMPARIRQGFLDDPIDRIFENRSQSIELHLAKILDLRPFLTFLFVHQMTDGCDNPFIVIIVTAWEKSTGLINRVVNSGADDLLLRPFSTALLGSRIEAHIERRKGFVITTDYVGPDRRQSQVRQTNAAETFDPPNSLKMKAKDK